MRVQTALSASHCPLRRLRVILRPLFAYNVVCINYQRRCLMAVSIKPKIDNHHNSFLSQVSQIHQSMFCPARTLLSLSLVNLVTHRTMSFQTVKESYLKMDLDEKRHQYKCGSKFLTLDKISKWSQSPIKRDAPSEDDYPVDTEINSKISLFVGDITTLEIDAIVNAANSQLAGGGGVDGFIHRAAGAEDLQKECRALNGCETGKCKITGGYKLPAKYIIHCVGPVGEKPDLLSSCYKQALDTLVENNLRSIAFPCISTGVYGYPNEKAARVALKTVRDWLSDPANQTRVDRIIFCLFLEKDHEIYNILLPKYFPMK